MVECLNFYFSLVIKNSQALFIYLSVLDANEGRKPGALVEYKPPEKLKKLIEINRSGSTI